MSSENLREYIKTQKDSLTKLEEITIAYDKDNILQERNDLLVKKDKLESEVSSLKEELHKTTSEKNQLKDKLFDFYYKDMEDKFLSTFKYLNQKNYEELLAYEKELYDYKNNFEKKLSSEFKRLKENNLQEVLDMENKINLIKNEISTLIKQREEEAKILNNNLSSELNNAYAGFSTKELSEEDVKKEISRFNLELKIGGKITNAIGILFVMISLLYGSYLAYDFFGVTINDTVKTILMYLLGAGFVLGSEVSKNKVRRFFSLGLLGGGIGIFYITTAVGYFIFDDVLTSSMTVLLIVLISVVAFLLAVRNDATIIAIFALIGGYMPLIEFKLNVVYVTNIAIYIFILNLFALLISTKKDWKSVKYLSFTLNLFTMIPFVFLVINKEYWGLFSIMLYITAIYIANLLVAIYYPIKNNFRVSTYEKVLLFIGTSYYSGISIYSFYKFVDEKFIGFPFLVLFAFFYLLAYTLEKFAKGERELINLFYVVAFGFTFIAIPAQFGAEIAFVALAVEVTALLCYGLYMERGVFKWIGIVGLTLLSFYEVYEIFANEGLLNLFILVLAYIATIGVVYYKNWDNTVALEKNKGLVLFKNYTILAIYAFVALFLDDLDIYYMRGDIYVDYAGIGWLLVFSLINIGLFKTKRIMDKYTITAINIYNMIALVSIYEISIYDGFLGFIVVVVSIIAYLYSFMLYLSSVVKIKDHTYTAIAFVCMYVINGIFDIINLYSYYDIYFSIVSLIIAFFGIIIGFRDKLPILRKAMLGTVYVFILKIFLLDMSFNTSFERVIAYFILGVILILVSFVYQKFSKSIYTDLDNALFNKGGEEE